MRFSLKWLLAGMLYAALIAAAITQNSWLYADVLWLIGFLAFGYAAATACLARGTRRARGLGFAILLALYGASAQFAPASLPTTRWVIASLPASSGDKALAPIQSPEAYMSVPALGWSAFWSDPHGVASMQRDNEALGRRLRATNSVAAMLAGLIGSVLGVVSYRRGREVES